MANSFERLTGLLRRAWNGIAARTTPAPRQSLLPAANHPLPAGRAAMTEFERALQFQFRESVAKGYRALLVVLIEDPHGAITRADPANGGILRYNQSFRAVPNDGDATRTIDAFHAEGHPVVIALDTRPGRTLARQFPDWLPGTIRGVGPFLHKPVISLDAEAPPRYSRHVPRLDESAPDLPGGQDNHAVKRGWSLKGEKPAPAHIRGLIAGG